MEDVDDSSSEAKISVTDIIDLANLPHTYNKKVYSLLLSKDPQNNYNALRIGFNLYKLPEGEYTICIEFISVTMNNVVLMLNQRVSTYVSNRQNVL